MTMDYLLRKRHKPCATHAYAPTVYIFYPFQKHCMQQLIAQQWTCRNAGHTQGRSLTP